MNNTINTLAWEAILALNPHIPIKLDVLITPGFTDKKLVKGAQIQEATTPSLKVPRVQLAMTGS